MSRSRFSLVTCKKDRESSLFLPSRPVSQSSNKPFSKQVEDIKRKKIINNQVVKFDDLKSLKEKSLKKRILVVDDDDSMRNALKRLLEDENYHVFLAEDADSSSKIIETTKLDLVLLDVNMPMVDGLELCQLLQKSPTLRKLPVIFISARKSPEDINLGMQAGARAYISKPFDIEFLLKTINSSLAEV